MIVFFSIYIVQTIKYRFRRSHKLQRSYYELHNEVLKDFFGHFSSTFDVLKKV